MLIFDRKANQSFTIGSDITIKILKIRGRSIRVGISAPSSLAVIRDDAKHNSSYENNQEDGAND